MYCPKCGSQNADGTRFCRGCGTDVGNVLAIVEGWVPEPTKLAEKQIEKFASGLRSLIIGIGLLLVSGVSLGISIRLAVLAVFASAAAVVFLGVGISRLVHAKALKNLIGPKSDDSKPALTAGETEYVRPARALYETEGLVAPSSVTDRTTRHLELNPESETSSKK